MLPGESRRNFLKCCAALTSFFVAQSQAGNLARDRSGKAVRNDASRLGLIVSSLASQCAIGEAYLSSLNPQPTQETLLQDLGERIEHHAGRAIEKSTLRQLHAAVGKCIRQDFAEERTTPVNGWLLSETEVLLCALTAASYSRG
jgi:hypothetical protein